MRSSHLSYLAMQNAGIENAGANIAICFRNYQNQMIILIPQTIWSIQLQNNTVLL